VDRGTNTASLPVDGLYAFEGASAETASGFVNRILVQATDRSPEAIGELARWVDGSLPFSAGEADSVRS
jgi:hypothetical protein